MFRAGSCVVLCVRSAVRYGRGWGIAEVVEVDTSDHDMEWLSLERIDPFDTRMEADELGLSCLGGAAHATNALAHPVEMRLM